MKKILLFTCFLAVLLFTCSKKSTPPEDNPPPNSTLSISYTADPARALEQAVLAATGGSVTASDVDGIQFTLNIPPSALPFDATVRVTPLASLNLGGVTGPVCAGCTGGDSLCCLHGILLEPEGLVLDSPATLTVTFPAGQFPFHQGGWIAYIDSAGPSYNICRTVVDTINHSLAAQITHFSGYGSDDPRYDQLEAEIYEIAARLEAAIGSFEFGNIGKELLQLYLPCHPCGYYDPDFSDLYRAIETILLDCWTRHVDAVRHSGQGTNCNALQNLYWQWYMLSTSATHKLSNWESFMSLEGVLMSDARAMAHFVADLGKQQCTRDSCAAGQHSLSCVISFIRDARIAEQEGELLDSAVAWFTSCCKNQLLLSVNKPKIYDFALAEGDESQLATFTVALTDAVGPIPDHDVVLTGYNDKGQSIGGQATTDEDGVARILVVAVPEGILAKPMGSYKCVASATVGEDQVKSDTVRLTITGRVVVMNYLYQYTQSGSTEYCSVSGNHYFSGIGKISFAVNCGTGRQWLLTRKINVTSSCTTPSGSTTTILRSLPRNDSAICCFFDVRYESRWIDEPAPGYPQYLLVMARVNWQEPLSGCVVEVTQIDQYGTRVDTTENSCYAWTPDRDYYVDTSLFQGGAFKTLVWDTTFVGQQTPYTYHPSWTISFQLEED